MNNVNDRRLAARKQAHFVAEIETGGLRIGCGISRDASKRGLLLLARTALASRTEIVIHLLVPGEDDPRALKASVVRWEAIPPGDSNLWTHKIGVTLEEPPPDLEEVIDRIVKPTRI